MSYFYHMLGFSSKEEGEKKEGDFEGAKEREEMTEEKMTEEEIFMSQLELKYQIYGKRFVLERNINSILLIISNKPRLYSTDKKKQFSLFHYELVHYYRLYLIIHKEFEYIKNDFYFRKKFIYLQNKNNYVFNYIQDKYQRFSVEYVEEMKEVPELLDLKNNIIRLVYEVMLKLVGGRP